MVTVGNDFSDLNIDPCTYPFMLEDEKLLFAGEGWKSGMLSMMFFDADSRIIQHGDYALGERLVGKNISIDNMKKKEIILSGKSSLYFDK